MASFASALTLLIVLTVLCGPIAVWIHTAVLGAAARKQAIPLLPLTGIAVLIVSLGVARQSGLDFASNYGVYSLGVVTVIAICALVVRRQEWMSRDFGIGSVWLLAVMLFVAAPFGDGERVAVPAYGTDRAPVEQITAIRAAMSPTIRECKLGRAGATSDKVSCPPIYAAAYAVDQDQPNAFTSLAAFVGSISPTDWTEYTAFSLLSIVLGSLVALPLFLLARWRGVRNRGLLLLMATGALAPPLILAAAVANAAGVAAVPFATASILSLLLGRRDRGWYALSVLFGSAVWLLVGVAGIVPLVAIAIVWLLTVRHAAEHLKYTDVPVEQFRPLSVSILVVFATVFGAARALEQGNLSSWTPMFDELYQALMIWPFSWMGTNLQPHTPTGAVEILIWACGIILVGIAALYAVVRSERRERSIVVGVLVSLVVGSAVYAIDSQTDVVELTLLLCAPVLSFMALRAIGIARTEVSSAKALEGRRKWHFRGVVPALLGATFVLMSVAAVQASSGRFLLTPDLSAATPEPAASVLLDAPIPWLQIFVNGVPHPIGDLDDYVLPTGDISVPGLPTSPDQLWMDSNPFASDPSRMYTNDEANQIAVSRYSRRFLDVTEPSPGGSAAVIDPAREPADSHTPAEGKMGPDWVGGLLVPPHERVCVNGMICGDVAEASSSRAAAKNTFSTNSSQSTIGDCTKEEVRSAQVALGVPSNAGKAPKRTPADAASSTSIDSAPLVTQADTAGVACWDVELQESAKWLLVHVKDIGVILEPTPEALEPRDGWSAAASGMLRTSRRNTVLRYGITTVNGSFDLTMEGKFGAETGIATSRELGANSAQMLATIPEGYGRWSPIFRNMALAGNLHVHNTGGSRVEVGWIVLRPSAEELSCDFMVPVPKPDEPIADVYRQSSSNIAAESGSATVLIVRTRTGKNGIRTARLLFGNGLRMSSYPSRKLVDYTEQFTGKQAPDLCS